MTKDLISFIILTFKNFDGLYGTLDSLFKQDYPKIELIISDDGSPNADEEFPKIEEYIDKNKSDNIVNVIINKIKDNVGTVKNLNAALKLANGEYIKDIGADDTLNCIDALSRFKNFIDKSESLICVSKLRVIDNNGNYNDDHDLCKLNYDNLRKMTPHQLLNKLFDGNFIPSPCVFFKKELFEKYGYYPEDIRIIEDYPFWIYLCKNNVKFAFFDDKLIDYKVTNESRGISYNKMHLIDMITIHEKYIFPSDRRYGILQPLHNKWKKDFFYWGMAKAEWDDYSVVDKLLAYV